MFRLIHADCIEAMQAMDENSVDAIVTDPPYGLEFMGKEWDSLRAPLGRKKDGGSLNGGAGLGGFSVLPTRGSPNPSCRSCGGTKRGRDRKGFTRCVCKHPDFPRVELKQALAMQEWHHAWATEALRVLKPGAHLLAFGGTRTYHRLACAIEDAGFEIRDCLAWLYGSGFPKSLDVSKAIDKAAGAEREVVGEGRYNARRPNPVVGGTVGVDGFRQGNFPEQVTAPATPDAERWQGFGTALKPAHEPIVLARKPLSERNVALNVQRWGTGALNIDGCRIETEERPERVSNRRSGNLVYGDGLEGSLANGTTSLGRWPPNVTMDTEAAAMLDAQTGETSYNPAGQFGTAKRDSGRIYGGGNGLTHTGQEVYGYGDTGGASRFLYVAKADREERNRGLDGWQEYPAPNAVGDPDDPTRTRGSLSKPRANTHPTVKPVALMSWLCRMVTPPKGTILDPFTGSGSTGMAALREGFEFIGIEREAEYVEIARARIIGDAPLFNVEADPVTVTPGDET